MSTKNWSLMIAATVAVSSCGFHHAKYENPISKDTQQPDKVLYDKSIHDIEKGRYEVARLTLNTLINTYDSSEFLAKAKLAIADSWYREGGIQGLTQAEAEYKDFILFYPTMEEAAESQKKLCDIHFRQMDKADRDLNQALRAEQECKQVLTQFPNSKFAPAAEQQLRSIQEVLADAEARVGDFYHHKGSWAAAANRLGGVADSYPLYSSADDALWEQADAYSHMGPRFRQKEGEAYAKIVRDYPLSEYADASKKKLMELEMEVPAADPAAVARMKYEEENRTKRGMLSKSMGWARSNPDTSLAAKSGTPQMNNPKQNIPANVPVPADAAGFNGDVTVAPVAGASALDTKPDARLAQQPGTASSSSTSTTAAPARTTQQDDGANAFTKGKPPKKTKNNKKQQPQQTPAQAPAPPQSSTDSQTQTQPQQ